MIVALANTVVSFYYYLKVLKQVYVSKPQAEWQKVEVPLATQIVVWAAALLLVVLGCLPQILLNRMAGALDL